MLRLDDPDVTVFMAAIECQQGVSMVTTGMDNCFHSPGHLHFKGAKGINKSLMRKKSFYFNQWLYFDPVRSTNVKVKQINSVPSSIENDALIL